MATGNFAFDNRCIVVTDDDYDNGNIPSFGEYDNDSLRSYPSRFLEMSDDFDYWNVVITSGYYGDACIDYKRNDADVENWMGAPCYINSQSELISEVKNIFGFSRHKTLKICGKVSECANIDIYIERAYERLTEHLADEEEKKVNEALDKLKKEYGYDEVCVDCRASNGETAYRKIG